WYINYQGKKSHTQKENRKTHRTVINCVKRVKKEKKSTTNIPYLFFQEHVCNTAASAHSENSSQVFAACENQAFD
ncbi:hypothetical protein GGP41_000683, partial [Bipolaris sorokiniana]